MTTKNTYRVKVQVMKTWMAEDEIEVEVEAENEKQAHRKAEDAARAVEKLEKYDADLDEVSLHAFDVVLLTGDEPTPRCKKTPDMFQ